MLERGPKQKSVLILGDQTAEMEPVRLALQEIGSHAELIERTEAEAVSTVRESPDLIIICQNWPDEFPTDILENLVTRFPLSRYICCYGAWCEADGRTRMTWPFSIRVPARSIASRIRQEWDIIVNNSEVFPLTSGRDEIFLQEATDGTNQLSGRELPLRICVISGDRQYGRILEDQIRNWGCEIVSSVLEGTADVVVYDLDPWEPILQLLMARRETVPVIGMMGLAHPEIVAAARQWGVREVVTKLAPETELFHAIDRISNLKAYLPEES